MTASADAPSAAPHPGVFLILIVPFGLVSGFLTVALAYELAHHEVPASAIALLIAVSYLPHTWKFLWAPIVDKTLTRKRWYLISTLLSAIGLGASGALAEGHPALWALTTVVLIDNVAVTIVAMAVESLMAASVPDSHRGRASGWYQAGNLGGTGIGGGLGLWLIQSAGWSTTGASAALGIVCVLCCLALRGVAEPPAEAAAAQAGWAAQALDVLRDLWALVRSRVGALAVVICFLPIGSGAASNLWSVVADDWHASANLVALVNGALGGFVSAIGCVAGGWICDRVDRRGAYCAFGAALALCAVAMALAPRTPSQFVLWVTLYSFILGLSYAGYSAVVLEAIGRTLAATKFSLLAALSNMPIAYVTLIDGQANERWGTRGMLLAEAAAGACGLVVFIALAATTRRRAAPPLAA